MKKQEKASSHKMKKGSSIRRRKDEQFQDEEAILDDVIQ